MIKKKNIQVINLLNQINDRKARIFKAYKMSIIRNNVEFEKLLLYFSENLHNFCRFRHVRLFVIHVPFVYLMNSIARIVYLLLVCWNFSHICPFTRILRIKVFCCIVFLCL